MWMASHPSQAGKPETCAGMLRVRLGNRPLDGARHRIRPGRRRTIELNLSPGEARQARGKRLTLHAAEIDDDGRDRSVSRRVRLKRERTMDTSADAPV